MSSDAFLRRCLASAGISITSLSPVAISAAYELRQRKEPLWRTVADERRGNLEIVSELLRASGASDDQVRQVSEALLRYFDLYTLVPGIRDLLNEMRDLGAVQGVVSNWPPSLKAFLDHHDLLRYFKVVVGSGEYGVAKPDLAIFQHALRKLGVSVSDCIYIGDNLENDIWSTEKLGMQSIHFDPRRRWENADATVVERLRDLLMDRLR